MKYTRQLFFTIFFILSFPNMQTITFAQNRTESTDVKWTQIENVCTQVLNAYKSKDNLKLSKLSTPKNQEFLQSLTPNSSRYLSIFGPTKWRWKAVSKWDGHIREIRRSKNMIRCLFSAISDHEVATVTLQKFKDQWLFEDIHSPTTLRWKSWGHQILKK